ncbi:unnamed protein product [Darwinula stevensoni]|uniref:ABC transmembrane type-1 domain-containing protein n=1 Tax=Darwinula stevensoni TaxID=69355 RepID=A0A7R8XF69_9CRUS|nr:unnamed protein product [Darwinula stevensoni]CAG0894695.1 unnamed protein product [Darwinula stevensoni]
MDCLANPCVHCLALLDPDEAASLSLLGAEDTGSFLSSGSFVPLIHLVVASSPHSLSLVVDAACQFMEEIAEIEVIIHLMFQALACLFTYMEKARSIPKSCILLTFEALLFFKGSVSLWSRVRHLLYDVNLFILSLRLSPAARKKSTVGEMVNLMSVDAKRFLDIPFNLSMILALPIQLGIAGYLLWAYLGPSVLTGMGVILIAIPFHGVIASRLQKLQVQQIREKDERVKLMNEVLNGIKVLKLYAWELQFQERIMKFRDGEIQLLRKQAYVESIGSFLHSSIPFLVLNRSTS